MRWYGFEKISLEEKVCDVWHARSPFILQLPSQTNTNGCAEQLLCDRVTSLQTGEENISSRA
jgi:hypothetical protein